MSSECHMSWLVPGKLFFYAEWKFSHWGWGVLASFSFFLPRSPLLFQSVLSFDMTFLFLPVLEPSPKSAALSSELPSSRAGMNHAQMATLLSWEFTIPEAPTTGIRLLFRKSQDWALGSVAHGSVWPWANEKAERMTEALCNPVLAAHGGGAFRFSQS